MNLLYIIFTALVSNFPIPPEDISPVVPTVEKLVLQYGGFLQRGGFLQNQKFQGYDERFSAESNDEEKYRLSLLLHYFEQLQLLQQFRTTSLECVIKNPIICDVLRQDEIRPIQPLAGGLMDDWERDIL